MFGLLAAGPVLTVFSLTSRSLDIEKCVWGWIGNLVRFSDIVNNIGTCHGGRNWGAGWAHAPTFYNLTRIEISNKINKNFNYLFKYMCMHHYFSLPTHLKFAPACNHTIMKLTKRTLIASILSG